MSILSRIASFRRLGCWGVAALFALGLFCRDAAAQAAPQLLPYTVTAVAGGGGYTSGTSCPTSGRTATDNFGDGCLASEVQFGTLRGAATDDQGNVYLVDAASATSTNLIRRVDAHTGVITLVAGSAASNPPSGGTCPDGVHQATSSNGDGCLATQVKLAYPHNVAVDPQGNVWFPDYSLGSVRKIDRMTGVLSTVVNTAGTPGYYADNVGGTGYLRNGVTAATGKLDYPYSVAFDKSGNLYIADEGNNVVDVVNLSGTTTIAGYSVTPGDIFTIAGTGCPYTSSYCGSGYYGYTSGTHPSAGTLIDGPYQVAVDQSGNIFIANEYQYDVLMINGSTGQMSTYAGLNSSSTMSNTATLPRGAANSTPLGYTYSVAADLLGNVYVGMYKSPMSIIARVDQATLDIYPVGGQHTTGTATAPTGTSYCSPDNDSVGDGCPGQQATFAYPYQLSVDAAGNLFVVDQGNKLVRKLSTGTQFPPTAVGSSSSPQTLEVHFGANDGNTSSSAYSLPAGETEFTINNSPSCNPANSDNTMDCTLSITFKPAAAGVRTATLTVTSLSGQISTFALTGTGIAPVLAVDPGTQSTLGSGLTAVSGVAIDGAGNAYASVPGNASITKISASGGSTNVGSNLAGANAVAVDGAGNIYAAIGNGGSGSVVEIPASSAAQVTIGSGFTNPAGIAVDSYGNIYVADETANNISEIIAGTGVQVTLACNSSDSSCSSPIFPLGTGTALSGPTGVAVDSYGNVFVSSTASNTVVELPFNGSSAISVGTGFDAPMGLAVDPAGSLYVTDSKNHRIEYIPNENGTFSSSDQIAIPVANAFNTPTGVAIAGDGTLYVADSNLNAVYKIVRSSGSITFDGVNIAVPAENVSVGSESLPADVISMGNVPASVNANFATAGGANIAGFTLSPASIPTSPEFPNAGYGMALMATFSPTGTTTGARSGSFTFATGTTLSVSGEATNPNETATVAVSTAPPAGQTDWIYGQTPQLTVTVTYQSNGVPATPSGTVKVTVDGTVYTATLANSQTTAWQGVATVSLVSLGAGPYSVNVTYGGDDNFKKADNSATPFSFTVDKAPLTVTGETIKKAYGAPIPVLTGTDQGLAPGDTIAVSYTTPAVATSPVTAAGYPIVPAVTGSALNNYTVTPVNGTLFVTQESTQVALTASSTSVNPTTQVTLAATVAGQTAFPGVLTPTGYVAFYNTLNGVTTQIGSNAQVNSSGVASLTTTFSSGTSTTNNVVTAVYLGDPNYQTSAPTAGLAVVSGTPTFAVAPTTTNSSLTIEPGQSGLTSFTMSPAYGYNGTITFSCTAPSTVTCSFAPASIVANGQGTPTVVTLTINTQPAQTTTASVNKKPASPHSFSGFAVSLAALPGIALLFGLAKRRRKLFRGIGFVVLAVASLFTLGLGLSGCSGGVQMAGTPAGATTITVVASGSGGAFASVTQQFNLTLNVQ